jgi:hypothetical protein
VGVCKNVYECEVVYMCACEKVNMKVYAGMSWCKSMCVYMSVCVSGSCVCKSVCVWYKGLEACLIGRDFALYLPRGHTLVCVCV